VVDDVYPGRAVGISWDQLRRCPCVVVIAAGDGKVAGLHTLIEARMIHVLVTDERTALQIVNGQ
jgi:DNA-binding transcriptional regulator LsrR (DeoR family)